MTTIGDIVKSPEQQVDPRSANARPVKIARIALHGMAGYRTLIWEKLQDDINFLVGRNGVGKSTLLETLSFALNYMAGRRTEGVLSNTYPEGEIEITFTDSIPPWKASVLAIHQGQGPRPPRYPFMVLYSVENRQPKSRMGEQRSRLIQHPLNRYPNSLSELRRLLGESGDNYALAGEVLDICRTLDAAGTPADWDWIERAILQRRPTQARPVSCGQFDVIAIVLDLVKLKRELAAEPRSPFIILDNPDTFLHPACQDQILGLVRQLIPKAQVFVSSHSLKLLAGRQPKSVFWLSATARTDHTDVYIRSIRDLDTGALQLFFEVYGDDISSALMALIHSLERPEYYRFLCECALGASIEVRKNPALDKQIVAVRPHVAPSVPNAVILDFGAGAGDLLVGLLGSGDFRPDATYIAVDRTQHPVLKARMEDAIARHVVSSDSRYVCDLASAPRACDVVVLCNVCHEILLPQLPTLLAELICDHLRTDRESRLVIHEIDDLVVGESQFLMWTPDDYLAIFEDISGLSITPIRMPFQNGVSLSTTIVSLRPENARSFSRSSLTGVLLERFLARIPDKKSSYLDHIELWSKRTEGRLPEAIRQRRVASLLAQITTICLIERRLGL